ncbi:MAG: RNA methyltransferase [Candidatus Aminicenantaceae bacterium]
MEAQANIKESNLKTQKRFTVVLARPEKPENIGLVARNMKNTGFKNLRLVSLLSLDPRCYLTAVHAKEVLENARFYPTVAEATADLDLVFAATSKKRKIFTSFSLDEAVDKMLSFPPDTGIGLLFGNERTGLTSNELMYSNFRFTITQASSQPSYNLASAVLLTLYQIFKFNFTEQGVKKDRPLSRKQQEEFIQMMLSKLEKRKFIHSTNREHITEMMCDLFGRITLSDKDRRLLLAIFSKI